MSYLKDQAIRSLNPNIVTIRGNIAYDQDENVIEYDMTAVEAKIIELEVQAQAAAQAIIDAKHSALAKLTALGLTQDEVKALLG